MIKTRVGRTRNGTARIHQMQQRFVERTTSRTPSTPINICTRMERANLGMFACNGSQAKVRVVVAKETIQSSIARTRASAQSLKSRTLRRRRRGNMRRLCKVFKSPRWPLTFRRLIAFPDCRNRLNRWEPVRCLAFQLFMIDSCLCYGEQWHVVL